MANSKYKLTYFNITGVAEVSRLIFAYAKVPFEDDRLPKDEYYPTLSPELKSKLPWGQVPVMQVDGKEIAQARAINRFLARRFNLTGNDEFEAAKCDELIDALMDFFSEFVKMLMQLLENVPEKKAELLKNIVEAVIPKYMGKFNDIIQHNGGKFLVGSVLTWADIYVHHITSYLGEFWNLNLSEGFPAFKKAGQNFYNTPEIKHWMATRPASFPFTQEIVQELIQNMFAKK